MFYGNSMQKEAVEKFAHIAGVLALIISSVNVYYTHFDGPDLSIQLFPPKFSETHQFEVDKDIIFSFQLHNSGGKTAFIKSILIYQITGSGNEIIYIGAKAEPTDRFYINPGATKEIIVTIPAPGARITNEFKIVVHQESPFELLESEPITVTWT